MAYLRGLKRACNEELCSATAVEELISFRNESCGVFCKKHAAKRLARQKAIEEETMKPRVSQLAQ